MWILITTKVRIGENITFGWKCDSCDSWVTMMAPTDYDHHMDQDFMWWDADIDIGKRAGEYCHLCYNCFDKRENRL